MAQGRYTRLNERIEQALKEKPKRTQLYNAMKRGRDSRRSAIDVLPGGEDFRKEVRGIKLKCLDHQDELVDRFACEVRARGAKVALAKDGPEAIAYILKLAEEKGARSVAKSKSLTSEEIEVNHPMEEAGMEELDEFLGDDTAVGVEEDLVQLIATGEDQTEDAVDEDILEDFETVQESLLTEEGAAEHRANVLLVDDDAENRQLFEDALADRRTAATSLWRPRTRKKPLRRFRPRA